MIKVVQALDDILQRMQAHHNKNRSMLRKLQTNEGTTMKPYKVILSTLAVLAIAPVATAQVYKCAGPDGPIYSDRECGPNAATVELRETSGVSGVSDKTKAGLAEKKAEREKDRSYGSRRSNSNNAPVSSYQNQAPVGDYWQRGRVRPRASNPTIQPVQPIARPSRPIGGRRD